jgi:hypothetical protein
MNSVVRAKVTLTLEITLAGVFGEEWAVKDLRKEAKRAVQTAIAHVSDKALGSAIRLSEIETGGLIVHLLDTD